MAKGGYFIIGYPCDERHPLSIESFVSAIQDKGGEVAYILHDKDFKDDGSPVAPHYHVLCMWSSGVLPWSDFVDILKVYNYRAFDMSHEGKTAEDNQFCERVARVRDVDACLHYMTHEP